MTTRGVTRGYEFAASAIAFDLHVNLLSQSLVANSYCSPVDTSLATNLRPDVKRLAGNRRHIAANSQTIGVVSNSYAACIVLMSV